VTEGQTFRRRSHRAGALVLLDEAVAVFQEDPLRWTLRGMLPSLPVVVLALGFVHLHRVLWVDDAWQGLVPLLSAASAVAMVLALQVRSVGQGLIARDVVETLHPDPGGLEPLRSGSWLSLIAVGTLGLTTTLVGLGMLLLPGLLLAGFFAPLAAIVAVEGRDAGSAMGRARELPRGTTFKGATSALLFGGLLLLAWLDVLIGTQLAISLFRIVTGADVTVLARTLGVGNEAFVVGSLILAFLLLDPLWGIQKSLLYLEARLGQTGTDLEERWRALPDRQGGPTAVLGVLGLAVVGLAALPGAAIAADDLERYAMDLERHKEQLDTSIRDWKSSGYEDLSSVQLSIELGAGREVELPDGTRLRFSSEALAAELPDRIHTDETARQAMRVSGRMEAAIALARGEPLPSSRGADPRSLLDAELGDGSYALPPEGVAGDEFRSSLQEAFRAWWEGVVRSLTYTPPPPPTQQSSPMFPAFSGKWLIAGVALLLALGLAVFLLAQGGRIQVARPLGSDGGSGPGSDLPDARQRSPLGWREHADRLADQGFLREAVRAQFLAVLARLDRTREIDYRRERTNGEHLRTFTGSPARMDRFGAATAQFEEAWYGGADVGGEDYSQMSASCDALVVRESAGGEEQ